MSEVASHPSSTAHALFDKFRENNTVPGGDPVALTFSKSISANIRDGVKSLSEDINQNGFWSSLKDGKTGKAIGHAIFDLALFGVTDGVSKVATTGAKSAQATLLASRATAEAADAAETEALAGGATATAASAAGNAVLVENSQGLAALNAADTQSAFVEETEAASDVHSQAINDVSERFRGGFAGDFGAQGTELASEYYAREIGVPAANKLAIQLPNVVESQNGIYLSETHDNAIWVREDALMPRGTALTGEAFDGAQHRFFRVAPSTLYLQDCLHCAEEVMHGATLAGGADASAVGGVAFGTGEAADDAKIFEWAQANGNLVNANANPQVGQAVAILPPAPVEMEGGGASPFHAAPVIARDGNEYITMETFAGQEDAVNPDAEPQFETYTVGGADSFHSIWANQLYGNNAVTVVLDPIDS